jgi:hypothetical protein
LAAEAAEHLCKLQSHVAAAKNEEVRRDEIKIHHCGVCEVWHRIDPRDGRDPRPTADIEKDPVRAQDLRTNLDFCATDEARVCAVNGRTHQAIDPLLQAVP